MATFALTAVCLVLPVQLGDSEPARQDLAPFEVTAPADAPDIVLVIVDTLRADALDLEGTGAFAELAQQGAVFEQCISAASWTLPSVSSLLTGLLPSQHSATDASRVLPGDVSTLAEQLRAAGYQTAAFTGGAFVSGTFQLDQGFEHFDDTVEFGFRPFVSYTPLAWRLAKNRYAPLEPALRWVGEYPGFEGVCDAATDWLASRDASRPYFVVLHTYEVHDYFLHHPGTDAGIRAGDFDVSPRFLNRQSVHPSEIEGATQNDLDYFRAIYDRRLEHVDTALGKFIAGLGEEPEPGRVLAVVSDHGEGFDAARGRVNHGGRLHDDLVHVPLLLHSPKLFGGGHRVASQVSTLDLVPTFLALAGLRTPDELAGKSLLGMWEEPEQSEREAWSEERANGRDLVALRFPGWKLMSERGEQTYFNMAADPFEEAPTEDAPQEFKVQLATFEELYPKREGVRSDMSAEVEQHLTGIGYLGP